MDSGNVYHFAARGTLVQKQERGRYHTVTFVSGALVKEKRPLSTFEHSQVEPKIDSSFQYESQLDEIPE